MNPFFCVLVLKLVLFKISLARYDADGCEWGWKSYEDHCYYFGAKTTIFTEAVTECESLGSSLASVWSYSERNFLADTLWQRNVDRLDFGWIGLYGTAEDEWKWTDASEVKLNVTGMPQDKETKCGAVRGTGSFSFLECNTTVGAYFCKRAAQMLYVTSTMVNETYPTDQEYDHKAELFERVWPPRLTGMPNSAYKMATVYTISETVCAYYCYGLSGCKAFELKCMTSSKCGQYSCKLLSSWT